MTRTRTRAVVVGAVAVVAVAGGAAWYAGRDYEPASPDDGPGAAVVGAPMPTDAAPPTVPPVEEIAVDPPVESTGGAVDVVLTFGDWVEDTGAVEVAGYVAGVVESGGTCRLELTRDDRTVGAELEAQPDASTTVCGTLTVPRDDLSAGRWEAVLSYESATSSGASEPVDVEVPGR